MTDLESQGKKFVLTINRRSKRRKVFPSSQSWNGCWTQRKLLMILQSHCVFVAFGFGFCIEYEQGQRIIAIEGCVQWHSDVTKSIVYVSIKKGLRGIFVACDWEGKRDTEIGIMKQPTVIDTASKKKATRNCSIRKLRVHPASFPLLQTLTILVAWVEAPLQMCTRSGPSRTVVFMPSNGIAGTSVVDVTEIWL